MGILLHWVYPPPEKQTIHKQQKQQSGNVEKKGGGLEVLFYSYFGSPLNFKSETHASRSFWIIKPCFSQYI